MTRYLTPAVRKWIYGLALALLPLLIGYGVLSAEDAPLWAALIGAVLVPALAVTHTDTSTPNGMPGAPVGSVIVGDPPTVVVGTIPASAEYDPLHD